jgi:hypothetical protein
MVELLAFGLTLGHDVIKVALAVSADGLGTGHWPPAVGTDREHARVPVGQVLRHVGGRRQLVMRVHATRMPPRRPPWTCRNTVVGFSGWGKCLSGTRGGLDYWIGRVTLRGRWH